MRQVAQDLALAARFLRRSPLTRSSPAKSWPIRAGRRARAISPANCACLVCQNQSIDDSDAPLAKDLRILVREQLKDRL